jgi:hypothetical protein
MLIKRLALSTALVLVGLLAFFGSRFAVQQAVGTSTGSEHPRPLIVGLAGTQAPAPPSWPKPPPSPVAEEKAASGSEGSEAPATEGEASVYEESSGSMYTGGSSQETSTPEPSPPPSKPAGKPEGNEIIEEGVVGG